MARAGRSYAIAPIWRRPVVEAAVTTTAERGATTAGLATTAATVKVAKVVGTCSSGFAGAGAEKKLGVQVAAATVGATGTGLESTTLTAAPRPAVTVISTPRPSGFGRVKPALISSGLPRGQVAGTAETGTGVAGAAATGTAKKTAVVAGACTLGVAAAGTAKRVAPAAGTIAAAATATGTAKKTAPAAGTVLAAPAAVGAAKKVFAKGGTAAAGLGGIGSVSVWGPPPNLAATPISTTRIDLSWTAVALASGYDIERNGVVIASDVVGTTYSDTGLNPATTYTYRARSVHV